MAARTSTQVKRRVIGTGVAVTALAGLATAGWYAYAQGLTGLSRAAEVDTASDSGKAAAEHRLEQVVGVVPGTPRQLGTAASDHCYRHVPFEGEPAGPLSCQWRLERYLVFDGDLRTVGEEWGEAFGDGRWTGARASVPHGSGSASASASGSASASASASERYEYRDPQTLDRLVVTLVQDSSELGLLEETPHIEPFEEYERERRRFTGREAAEHALAEGRHVARISLVHAYYSQNGRPPLEPPVY